MQCIIPGANVKGLGFLCNGLLRNVVGNS